MTVIELTRNTTIIPIDGKSMGKFGRIQITSKELAKYSGQKISYNIVIDVGE